MPRDVVLIGTGAITALRHLPAVKRLPDTRVLGVVGTDPEQVARLAGVARAPHRAVVEVGSGELPGWVADADLVVVGTPPRTHTRIIEALTGPSMAAVAGGPPPAVVMEKPLLVEPEERAVWAGLAAATQPDATQPAGTRPGATQPGTQQVAVMHNFQFARGFVRAARWIAQGRIGEVTGVQCLQWSTTSRRLPVWYRDLPLGLFWDESVHFLYLARHLAGDLELSAVHAVAPREPGAREGRETTPRSLDVNLMGASGVPVSIAMRFGTAISEWGMVVTGTSGTIAYDMYRDVPILLPDDGPHRAPQIVRTSVLATVQHWRHTVDNGVRILRGTQLYGVDVLLGRVLAARGGPLPDGIAVADGLRATDLMRAIVHAAA